jgi:hypothetical protein
VLSDAKDIYTTAEAQVDTSIKQEEELVMHVHVMAEQEQAVEELEQRLHEREGLDDNNLGRKLEALATHESNLNSLETTLESE